jgi:hypothetical protein
VFEALLLLLPPSSLAQTDPSALQGFEGPGRLSSPEGCHHIATMAAASAPITMKEALTVRMLFASDLVSNGAANGAVMGLVTLFL